MWWTARCHVTSATALLTVLLALGATAGWAQSPVPGTSSAPGDPLADAVRELRQQVRELQTAVTDMRSEAAQSHAETLELHKELAATRAQLAAHGITPPLTGSAPGSNPAPPAPTQSRSEAAPPTTDQAGGEREAKLDEQYELLSGKVDEQYQTKVESASRYRVRLSGIVLLNLFSNQGVVDNQDFPELAQHRTGFDSGGNLGATLRQSQLGLEVFGPQLAGATTSGDVQLDFAGGFPDTHNGVTAGLVRLRTATLRMDWTHTSLVAGQDAPFFSPLSPTSFAALAVPALSYAGNLWSWIPQIRAERRVVLSEDSSLSFQGGILDALTGDAPPFQFDRVPQAGERSRQPGYAARVAWTHRRAGRPLTIGAGGYYSRQNWGFGRQVDGWSGTVDWSVPLGPKVLITGEFYRGRAIGGLGGGIGHSVVSSGPLDDPTSMVRGLNTVGAWSQLKVMPFRRIEFNAAFGNDSLFGRDLRGFSASQLASLESARNRGALVNFVFRPRSDLLFSTEYHRLRTFSPGGTSDTAGQINLVVGVLF